MFTLSVPKQAFNPVYLPFLSAQQRTQIFYGGAGSGKSHFLASRLVLDLMNGRNYLVIRNVAKTIRASCFAEVLKAVDRFGLSDFVTVNKSEMSITARTNGKQALFLGLDDVEKIKSITPATGALTDVWVEEATEASRHDVKQLEKRLRGLSSHLKRLTLSFNPMSRGHWIYKEYFQGLESVSCHVTPEILILRTTHRDNIFLTQDDRDALEMERDAYFHQVYTRGEWGVLGGAVFSNWHVDPLLLDTLGLNLRHGLDFGYSSDPAAAVRVDYNADNRRIYVLDEFAETGMTNAAIARKLADFAPGQIIICDSAEPKSIAELRRLGVRAYPARKGPDSVFHGLQWLMQHEIIVSPRCKQLQEELANYCWQPDGSGGFLPRAQGEDHLIDALRYAMEWDAGGKEARPIQRLALA